MLQYRESTGTEMPKKMNFLKKIQNFHRKAEYSVVVRGFATTALKDHVVMSPLNGLNEREKFLYLDALEFAEKEFGPNSQQWDETSTFPRRLMVEKVAKKGYGGFMTRRDVGGSEFTRKESVVICEALAKSCVSTTALITIHNACCLTVDKFAPPEHRMEWGSKLSSMEWMGSFCLTEPGSGSDAQSLKTKAQLDEKTNEWVISGEKAFISGAGQSSIYMVTCRTAPQTISTIAVLAGTPGLSFGSNENKMGWKSQPTRQVRFEDVRVPKSHLLAKEGEGFKIAMSGLDGGRLLIGACSLGAADACLEILLKSLQGRSVIEQGVLFSLADMYGKLHQARVLVRSAADMLSQNDQNARIFCAMAKRMSTEYASEICAMVMQHLGTEGLLSNNHVERYLRDIRVHQILEGTNEIMHHIVGRNIVA